MGQIQLIMNSRANSSNYIDLYSFLLKILFPEFTSVTHSRFSDLFSISKVSKKRSMTINPDIIMKGKDKRTTIMIKNIPCHLTYGNFLNVLEISHLVNYFYLPYNKPYNKILGFAFVNVKNYQYVLTVIDKISKYHNKMVGNKKDKSFEICYANLQGLRALIKSFGKEYLKI